MSAVRKPSAITCAWCDKPIGAGPHVRLAALKSIASPAAARAYFHCRCSEEIERLCQMHRVKAAAEPALEAEQPEPATAVRKKKPRPKAQPRAVEPRIPKQRHAPKPEPPDDVPVKVQDLATRGFKPQMIAAQLRVPYATVAAVLESAR